MEVEAFGHLKIMKEKKKGAEILIIGEFLSPPSGRKTNCKRSPNNF